MANTPALLISWIDQSHIARQNIDAALRLTGVHPDARAWQHMLDRLLLWLGVLAMSSAATFFVAFNWQELGRFAQFALLEGLLLIALLAYWRWASHARVAEVSLVAASLLLGTLLALFGQTYQTGADTWQLFASWALLILPWTLLGRSAVLWILWLGLLNLAVALYFQRWPGAVWWLFSPWEQLLWALFVLNTAAWVVWEWISHRSAVPQESSNSRWPQRLLALASGSYITVLVLSSLFEGKASSVLNWLVYAIWLAVVYWAFRKRWPELFVLAGACFSLIITLNVSLARLLSEANDLGWGFLLLSSTTVAMAGAAAIWLHRLHREFEA